MLDKGKHSQGNLSTAILKLLHSKLIKMEVTSKTHHRGCDVSIFFYADLRTGEMQMNVDGGKTFRQ